jgi:hypothetical protein
MTPEDFDKASARDVLVEALDALLRECGLAAAVPSLLTAARVSVVVSFAKRLAQELETVLRSKQVRCAGRHAFRRVACPVVPLLSSPVLSCPLLSSPVLTCRMVPATLAAPLAVQLNELGGLRIQGVVRRVMDALTTMRGVAAGPTVRSQFTRLSHIVDLWTTEKLADVYTLRYPRPTLAAAEVKALLRCRSDFNVQAIEGVVLDRLQCVVAAQPLPVVSPSGPGSNGSRGGGASGSGHP